MTGILILSYVDRSGVPEWATANDGRYVRIEPDEELQSAFSDWQSEACHHPAKLVLERQDAAGRTFYVEMCKRCGLRLSSALPHKNVLGIEICKIQQEVFENRLKNYESHRRQALDAIANQAAERQQPVRRAEYAQHLSSDQWRAIRAKVMKRANAVCEGCLDAQAEEVHHKTYAHIRSEFAFELVALCSDCHSRLHGHSA